MKIVECGNPLADDIKKSEKRRNGNATSFKVVKKDGKKFCAWCGVQEIPKGRRKYCSVECNDNVYAFAYPQKETGLEYHLQKQDFKCAGCNFDYFPIVKERSDYLLSKNIIGFSETGKSSFYLFKNIKWMIEKRYGKGKRPEVDHIVPIALGGDSIGLDNHQVLCYDCHKTKTKIDVSNVAKARREDGSGS